MANKASNANAVASSGRQYVADNPDTISHAFANRRRSKEYPREADQMKDENPIEPRQRLKERTPPLFCVLSARSGSAAAFATSARRQARAVNPAPDDERPIGAVPQAAQEHGDQEIAVSLCLAVAIAAQRNVEIIAEPRAQADVPAPPEILQARGEIRLAEVDHEVEAQQLRAAAGDIAVAAEVAVDLPGECIAPRQHGQAAAGPDAR